jgi:tripartite-type tricarboxylate transporter receptor subunit TctC
LLKRVTGIELVAIPYKGQPQALTDLMSGQVAIMYATPILVAPHIQTGRLRPLAVTSNSRLKQLPHVPTLTEAGLKDTLVAPWFGLVGRAGTPKPVIERLNAEVNKALAAPDVIARLETMAAQPAASTPEQFNRHLATEMARWSVLVKEANLRAD